MGGTYLFAIKYRETRKLKWERTEDRLCQGCIPSFKSKKKKIYIHLLPCQYEAFYSFHCDVGVR